MVTSWNVGLQYCVTAGGGGGHESYQQTKYMKSYFTTSAWKMESCTARTEFKTSGKVGNKIRNGRQTICYVYNLHVVS
jgi:hypothetical protein